MQFIAKHIYSCVMKLLNLNLIELYNLIRLGIFALKQTEAHGNTFLIAQFTNNRRAPRYLQKDV